MSENESKKILDLPEANSAYPVSFLSLKLNDSNGKAVSNNFYWLSAKPDVLDFEKTEWFYTPLKEFADFTTLKELAPAEIQVEEKWDKNRVVVVLKNPSPQTAFFIELRLVGNKSRRSIVPIFWDDNYVSLLPGESKEISGRFSPEDLRGENPVFEYSGWNVKSNITK